MKRRSFIRNTIATSTSLILLPSFAKSSFANEEPTLSDLERYFLNPPASARPWCFWTWMNGNITKEGITADLEAMERMGIGGVINFNSAVGIPQGPVDFASEEWVDLVEHAVAEAERLGIMYNMHNSPGYSGCGGPWVTPEMSMQQLVWTEMQINCEGQVNIQLPQPHAKRDYYNDAFVLAWPSLPGEKIVMKDALIRMSVNGNDIDKTILTDYNPETKIRLIGTEKEVTEEGKASHNNDAGSSIDETGNKPVTGDTLVMEFAEAFEARAITLYRKPEMPKDLFDGPRDHPPVFDLEYSDDNIKYKRIGSFRSPELREMDTPTSFSFSKTEAKFYRLSVNKPSWLCQVELHGTPRLAGWPGKTNNTHGDSNNYPQEIEKQDVIPQSAVIDITDRMDGNGNLVWNIPATTGISRWTILRIGHTTTGEETFAHPDASHGLQTDKFRTQALELHFEKFLDKVIDKLKKYKNFKGFTIDSWEAGKQNWSVDFPTQFEQKKKYSIKQWMPALTGRIVGSIEDTESFLWDVRSAQADLLSENFYEHYSALLHQRGLELYAEPYGDGNLDSLQIGRHLDITMSEFWTRHIYGSDITSIQAASVAHAYGRKVVAAESYTAMPATAKWTDYPYSLKAEGDYFFSLGVNRLVFHVFVHQPYTTGKPGMTMGPFGMHMDRNNTWTEQAYGWTKYLQRSQYLLQQGITVTDICIFRGDNPESGVPDIYRFLPLGYKGDIVGADVLHKRIKIINKKISLPDGMSYEAMVMISQNEVLPSTLTRIKELVEAGMILIINNKLFKTCRKEDTGEVKLLAKELFGELDGEKINERKSGEGKILWYKTPEEGLLALGIKPDFEYSAENPDAVIHYLHKRIGTDDVYFVCNHRKRKENIICSFRIKNKKPELWDAETGITTEALVYHSENGRTQLPLTLEPSSSIFIVFGKNVDNKNYHTVYKDGKEFTMTKLFPMQPDLTVNIINDFAISFWAKPDTYAHPNRSMLFHAPQGKDVYGEGHAAVAVGMGQNGVRVYERYSGNQQTVLEYNKPIEGWSYIVLQYKSSIPHLFVNGKLVATGNPSKFSVHPGIGTVAEQEQFASYFEGNYTQPQLNKPILSENEISETYNKGLPEPLMPCGISISQLNGKGKALIWENGNFSLQSAERSRSLGNINGCKRVDVTGEWKVKFPDDAVAPSEIILPSLISLHRHEDFDVKHFSGTCVYSKSIIISNADIMPDKRIFLHLGRVEVLAEVKVNGSKGGLLWKEPFMIDVTKIVKAGNNFFEIAVTNLWANRLIGDEYLSAENEYTEYKFIKNLPGWYVKSQPMPGKRKSFTVWKTHEKTDPLLESGLLGPVRLITAMEKSI